MRSGSRWKSWLIVCGVTAALSACTSIDQFATRQSHYNIEAEKAQDEAILLNILRARARRPLSFTELQSINASGTPSGSLGFNLPLTQSSGASASPSLSLSGGPTLSSGFINTQDFYRGILNPIPLSTLDLLIQRGISEDLLLNLMVARIIVTRTPAKGDPSGPQSFTALNDVRSSSRLLSFQRLVTVLLNRGLTTGPDHADPTPIGGLVLESDAGAAALLAGAPAAGLQVKKVDFCELRPAQTLALSRRHAFDSVALARKLTQVCTRTAALDPQSETGQAALQAAHMEIADILTVADVPAVYQLMQTNKGGDFRFCFAAPRSADGRNQVGTGVCELDQALAGGLHPEKSDTHRLTLKERTASDKVGGPDPLCAALETLPKSGLGGACQSGEGDGYAITLEMRSTYSVLYYLGEVVRNQSPNPGEGERARSPDLVKIKTGNRLRALPLEPCDLLSPQRLKELESKCEALFVLRPGRPAKDAFLSVHYDGQDYTIPDTGEAGKTNEVLDIVNELIALNHSGKDTPTSSLLNVIGVR